MKRTYGLDGEEILQCIKEKDLRGDEIGLCEKENKALECPHKLNYQPLDGKCVNEREKLKGAEDTAYGRFMRNSYSDCEFLRLKLFKEFLGLRTRGIEGGLGRSRTHSNN